MGVLVEAEVNGGKDTEEVIVGGKIRGSVAVRADDPVVYQLVRVEGDGRLVPATDDEVIEVEHLLESNKNEMPSVEGPCHSEGCVSSEVLPSKKSDFEGSEGLSQSENSELKSRKFNARLEYIEVMLQKVKEEERLLLSCESRHRISKYVDVDCIPSDQLNNPLACREKLQSENTLLETDPHPTSSNGSQGDQLQGVETCPEATTEPFISGLSISELSASLKTKISMLKGELCLDNLTIRELQEVFRATFGRETNVKDKNWLKRRVLMGLSNSYDLPIANVALKEKTSVNNEETEISVCWLRNSAFDAGSLSTGQDKGSKNYPCLETSATSTKQLKDHLVLSGKRPRGSVVEYDATNEDLRMEQIAAKRFRKPTKRYIEELSDVETRESVDTPCYAVKNSGPGQSSPVSRIRSLQNIGSQSNTFVTRQDSLGGFNIQIPYVSRVRRGRPRKNFTSLVNIAGMKNETDFMGTLNSEGQDLKHSKMDSLGDISDENVDVMPTLKCVARRKHHRAWTLTEVLKLVEGVAKYGTGRWSEIKRIAFASHAYRTSVDLKDKWRNLLKASFAQGPIEKGVRKPASMPIPRSILLRVRELAEIHSQTGSEFVPSKLAGHGRRAVQEKASGFL